MFDIKHQIDDIKIHKCFDWRVFIDSTESYIRIHYLSWKKKFVYDRLLQVSTYMTTKWSVCSTQCFLRLSLYLTVHTYESCLYNSLSAVEVQQSSFSWMWSVINSLIIFPVCKNKKIWMDFTNFVKNWEDKEEEAAGESL